MISRKLLFMSAALLAGCNFTQQGSGAGAAGTKEAQDSASKVERGKYLASIMDCAGCHNAGSFSPKPNEGYLQGGTVGFEIPGMGVFYPPNLTPHPDSGLGKWSEGDIATAVRTGRRPDGRILSPAMPWHAYSALTDEDAMALAAYLKSLPASDRRVPGPATKETAPQPYMTVVPPAQGG